MASTETPSPAPATSERVGSPLFSAVVGLAGLVILLQAVWAGLFIREDAKFEDNWVTVHSIGGTVALVLALIAVIVAFVQLRSRRDVVMGSIAFLLLLVVEAVIGGFIGGTPALETVHFPLALLLMAMTAWLSVRARGQA